MKHALKKNTLAEQAYVRSLERRGPLQQVERGKATILRESEYPEPARRFLARERRMLRIPLSASVKKKLERFSQSTGIHSDALVKRWIEQGLAREAG